jgi:hypothetical protein
VIARAVAERIGLQMGQSAQDVDVLAQRLQRLQDGRELETLAGGGGVPLFLNDAVRNVDKAEARRRDRCGGKCLEERCGAAMLAW